MSTRLIVGLIAGIVLTQVAAARLDGPDTSNKFPSPADSEKGLLERLEAPVSAQFEDVRLREVLDQLAEVHRINIVPDAPAIQQTGAAHFDKTVTLHAEEMPLKCVLFDVLRQCDLTWHIRDEVVFVTTRAASEKAKPKSLRIYPVSRLVTGKDDKPALLKDSQLIDCIINIEPKSWSARGGEGTIDFFPTTRSLIVNQTPEVHEQIQELLAQFRKKVRQNRIEVAFVTVSDEHFHKLGLHTKFDRPGSTVVLEDGRVKELVTQIQKDDQTHVTQLPCMTCTDGERLAFSLMQNHATAAPVYNGWDLLAAIPAGVRGVVRTQVAADRKSVNIQFEATVNATPSRVSKVQFATTIPAGKPVLVGGWTHDNPPHIPQPPGVSLWRPDHGPHPCQHPVVAKKEHLLILMTAHVCDEPADKVVKQPKPSTAPIPIPATVPAMPKVTKLSYTNSRSFALGYEVDNVGPSKLAGVDVWHTEDGKFWDRYPEQVKPSGEVPIDVSKDGRYGFTLIARSGAGLAKPAPKPDDDPQVWIEVDTVPPVVEMFALELNKSQAGTVAVTWKAHDRNLADRPIVAEWSTTKDGPWARATDAPLENTGRCVWTPDNPPTTLYVRLLAHDKAGNVTTTPAAAVMLDVQVPAVRDVKLVPRR